MRTVIVPLNYSKVMGLDTRIRYNELEEISQLFLTILEVNLKKGIGCHWRTKEL